MKFTAIDYVMLISNIVTLITVFVLAKKGVRK